MFQDSPHVPRSFAAALMLLSLSCAQTEEAATIIPGAGPANGAASGSEVPKEIEIKLVAASAPASPAEAPLAAVVSQPAPLSPEGALPQEDESETTTAESGDEAGNDVDDEPIPEPQPFRPRTFPRQTPGADVSALELGYFNSSEFKRRFAASFLSVSDVEPRTSADESVELAEIIELIQQDGKRERALRKLEKALNEASSANYPYLIAQLHQSEGRQEDALDYYLKAVAAAPNFRRAWQQIALLHYRRALHQDNPEPKNDYRQAARAFSEAISLGLVDATSFGMMGASLLNSDRVLAAETAFRQAIMMDPGATEWSMGLAQSLFRGKRYGDAASLLDSLIEAKPNEASLWLLQGNAYLGMEKTDLAARNFQVADQLGGATTASLNLLGDIYTTGGLGDVATVSYLKALTLDAAATPDRAIRAARMMTGSGDVESAKVLLEGIQGHYGEELPEESLGELLKLRAKIAVREGRGGDEIAVLREIVDRDPLDGDGMILLADALFRGGKLDESLQLLETAALIDGFEARAKVLNAQILVKEKRFAEAIPLLKASLQVEQKASVAEYLENVEKAARNAAK